MKHVVRAVFVSCIAPDIAPKSTQKREKRSLLTVNDNVELMNLFWTTAGMFPGDGDISRYDFKDRVEAAARAGRESDRSDSGGYA